MDPPELAIVPRGETGLEEVHNGIDEGGMKQKKVGDDSDDEEDIIDRFEYEVQESIADFADEFQIGRNQIPDSDDEEEDVLKARARRMRRDDDKFGLGTSFFTGLEFKEAVLEYALSNAQNIVQSRWDKIKLSFNCAMEGCQWRVYCSYDKPKQMWVVKTRFGYHTCTPNGKCKMLKSPVIGRLFMDKLREDTDLMPEDIQNSIKEAWKLVSTRNQCQRGRLLALKWLAKEYADQFAHLRGYAAEIIASNPGSTAIVDCVSNSAGEDVFARFYVCFHSLRSCWRGYCRPILGLDGTFLKVATKGILLTAVGHDANNQIYPVAWAVVQSENADNWMWFIKQLKVDFVLGDGSNFIIISDRGKGLISAVKAELPNVEHRMCVKHIIENLKKRHANKDMLKPLVWNLAWSYNPTVYNENLRSIADYNLALHNDVLKEEPKSWCRAFYRLGSCCEDVDNNATESFNASITKARTKAMVPMLETIRRQAMQRIAKRSQQANKHPGRFTRYVTKILESERNDAEKCRTYPATRGVFDVEVYGNSYNVNTVRNTCTCCKWQISGIPCEHAYGAMLDRGLDVLDFVSEFFSTTVWQETYNGYINPLRGPRFWMQAEVVLVKQPPEPQMSGRKKKQKQKKFPRKKGKHESPKKKQSKETLGRDGRIIHCSKCGEAGHNAAGCKLYPKKKLKKTEEVRSSSQIAPDELVITQPSQASNVVD